MSVGAGKTCSMELGSILNPSKLSSSAAAFRKFNTSLMKAFRLNFISRELFFLEIPRYLKKKKLHSVFTFTKPYLCATVGQILFFKPYGAIFDFCGHFALKVTVYLQGCLACKGCSACSLSFRYLNSYIKLKLIELAIKLYQELWNKMNCRIFHDH